MFDTVPPEVANTITAVGGSGALILVGWMANTASRVVKAVSAKWDEDRKQQLAIANHFAELTQRALRIWAETARRPEERDTVPLSVDAIGETSGPIRIPR